MRSRKPKRKSRLARSEMKRGVTPLKRRTPLDPGGPLKRTPISRGNALRSKPPGSRSEAEKAEMMVWRKRTLRRCERRVQAGRAHLVCPVCLKPFPRDLIEAHHVISKEQIKRYVAGLRLLEESAARVLAGLLWDARNGFPACRDCHQRHEKAYRRIPRSLLDEGHVEFADEIGLGYVLDRSYA